MRIETKNIDCFSRVLGIAMTDCYGVIARFARAIAGSLFSIPNRHSPVAISMEEEVLLVPNIREQKNLSMKSHLYNFTIEQFGNNNK